MVNLGLILSWLKTKFITFCGLPYFPVTTGHSSEIWQRNTNGYLVDRDVTGRSQLNTGRVHPWVESGQVEFFPHAVGRVGSDRLAQPER